MAYGPNEGVSGEGLGYRVASRFWGGLSLRTAGKEELLTVSIDLSPDGWVHSYETRLEALHRKQREEGALQNGVFHTPQPVAACLTRRTLGRFLAAHGRLMGALIRKRLLLQAAALMERMRAIRVVDPACGTGVFLVEALLCLHAFHDAMHANFPEVAAPWPAVDILRAQIFGMDIDPSAVEIARVRLAQWAGRLDGDARDLPIPDEGDSLRCGDALTDFSPEAACWDFVLGNPPYISEVRGQAERFRALRESPFYRAKMDLCDAFLAWAMAGLKPDGQLAYVLPTYWTQRTGTAHLRARLWREGRIREFWSMEGLTLFRNAPGHHSSFLMWRKRPPADLNCAIRPVQLGLPPAENTSEAWRNVHPKSAMLFLDPASGKLSCNDGGEIALLAKLSDSPPLLCPNEIQQGIVLPQGRLKIQPEAGGARQKRSRNGTEEGVFLLTEAEVDAMAWTDAERALLRPFYVPLGFRAFQGFPDETPPYWLIYTDRTAREAMARCPEDYPNVIRHLRRFSDQITSDNAPYGLHRARQPEWFDSAEKILCPRQVFRPSCALVRGPAYVGEGFYILRPQADASMVCALLNAAPAWYWLYHRKRKGDRLQIDKDVLSVFPAPPALTADLRRALAEATRARASETEDADSVWSPLDQLACRAYGLTDEETDRIRLFAMRQLS